MRSGLSTILQTLTPEAASVLNQSVAEAARRGHGQTTPLHVAATLLASPSGVLRHACVRSHPATSHPLQCRALELCFSVALDRLPSSNPNSNPSTSSSNASTGASNGHAGGASAGGLEQPPISNALMAALKRAQANQRRGCPEQQQQPLLAVKVELGQLVVSILDDPGVSRVMREASFSSPAVKATIEQSLLATAASPATTSSSPSPSVSSNPLPLGGGAGGILGGLGLRPARAAPGTPLLAADRSLYINPRLQQQQQGSGGGGGVGGVGGGKFGQQRAEVEKVLDILLRTRKQNPILVGDSQVEGLMKEVLQRIEKSEFLDGRVGNVEVISLEKQLASFDRSQIPHKLQELANSIDARFKYVAAAVGVVLDLGDLKWLVESSSGGLGLTSASGSPHHHQQAVAEMGRAVVAEMAKLLSRFADSSGCRVWLVGRASSATYLRCQVNHPTMEEDWDLQAVPIASRAPLPGILSRAGSNGVMGISVESLPPQKRFPPIAATTTLPARRLPSENADAARRDMCPVCKDSYEHDLAKLVAKEFEKSSSESKAEPRQTMPPWLQVAKLSNGNSNPTATQLQTRGQELMWKQTTEELLKRWTETCSRLHSHVRQLATTLEAPSLCNSGLLLRRSAQTELLPDRSCSPLQMSNHGGPTATTSGRPASPPGSPVRTDLVLGRAKPPPPEQSLDKPPRKPVAEPVGFMQDRFAGHQQREKTGGNLDFDSFKRLFRCLTEKVSWQPEAATTVATTVMQCKSGGGKRRGAGGRGDAWLLFYGPDKVGKKQMAMALSEMVAGCAPVTVRFGSPEVGGDVRSRGKTALDRVTEAVRRDPSSVLVLENVDRADMLVVGNLRRAMDMGRMADSHGRDVALGNVIFVVISDTSPEEPGDGSPQKVKQSEEKLLAAASSGWQLELAVGEKKPPGKRRPEWLTEEEEPPAKPRRRPSLGLSLDLNLAASATEEDATESSRNSSDVTMEHEQNDFGRLAVLSRRPTSEITELVDAVDEAVPFKPVDFGDLRRRVSETITRKFQMAVGEGRSLCIDEEALDRVVGGVWFGATPAAGFEEWAERVLVPGFQQLKGRAAADGSAVVRLLPDKEGCTLQAGAGGVMVGPWLPSRVRVAVECGSGT